MMTAVPEDVGIQKQLTSFHIVEWLRDEVFSLRWWCLLVFILAAVAVWFIIADKSRLIELCLFVTLGSIVVLGIFEYGEEMTLWDFPTDIIPIFPPLSAVNLISLPLIYSLLYQRYTALGSYTRAVLVVTAGFCFIMEPLLAWAGLYKLLTWNYVLSFLVYAIMALTVRKAVVIINAVTGRNKINARHPLGESEKK